MNSHDEFIKAVANLQPLLNIEPEYRLHYNDSGEIYMCSMQQHPENTQYLVVDQATYNSYFKYTVKDHQLKLIDTVPEYHVQLKSSTQGYAVVKGHAGILLENEEYKDVEYYDNY